LKAPPLPPLLEGVAEDIACADFGPLPDMERAGSAELAPSSAWPRPSGAFPLVKTRRLPYACSVCRGKPSASRSAVSRLIRKVSCLRRYRPGRFVREAAMTNAGPSAGTRRCISPHVFAVVMARSGRLLSPLRPMAPSMPTHKDHKKDAVAPRPARGHGSGRRLTPRWGVFRRLTSPRGGGPKGLRPDPQVARDLNPALARHYPAWSYAARLVRASCSAARPSPSRS
jgi:hypothetical protein